MAVFENQDNRNNVYTYKEQWQGQFRERIAIHVQTISGC